MSKKVTKFSWGAAAVAVLMAGCASSQPERGASSEEEKRAAAREKEQQAGKVEKEETEVIGHEMPGQIGTSTMSQGQATIPVRKRITRTVVSQNQMPTVKICEERADVNRMDKEDFIAVGFSQEAAQNILQARSQRGGRFGSLAELGQIAGVDQGLLKQLEPELGLSGEQTAAAGKQAG